MSEPAHAVIWRFVRHLYISCKNLTLTWGKYCQTAWNDLTFSLWYFICYSWNYSLEPQRGYSFRKWGQCVSLQTARPPSPTCSSSLPTSLNFNHLPRPRKPRDTKPKMRKLKYHQYIPPDQRGGSGTGGTNIRLYFYTFIQKFLSFVHSRLALVARCSNIAWKIVYFQGEEPNRRALPRPSL